jgi:hypothetical protein
MAKKKANPSWSAEFDRLRAQLRESTRPTPAADAAFQAIKKILQPFEGEVLKAKSQPSVPRYVLAAPVRSAGAGWEFARIEAETRYLYLTLPPLSQDCALRARLGPALQRCPRRFGWRECLTLTKATPEILAELGELVPVCYEWFLREVVAGHAQFAGTPLNDYTLMPDPTEDSDPEINLEPPALTSSPVPAALLPRLREAYGDGPWQQYNVTAKVELPGWSGPWEVEAHHYSRKKERAFHEAIEGAAEDWKIKGFGQALYPEQAVKQSLVYAAEANFRASLVPGKAYRCSATIGRKFNSYVRIADESGEQYWYPVRFFIGSQR